jgi:hypothetical protein
MFKKAIVLRIMVLRGIVYGILLCTRVEIKRKTAAFLFISNINNLID